MHIIYQSYGINGLDYCLIVTKDIVSKTPLNHKYYELIRNMSNVIMLNVLNVMLSDYTEVLRRFHIHGFFTLRYEEFILS